jgi:hypothetical protein
MEDVRITMDISRCAVHDVPSARVYSYHALIVEMMRNALATWTRQVRTVEELPAHLRHATAASYTFARHRRRLWRRTAAAEGVLVVLLLQRLARLLRHSPASYAYARHRARLLRRSAAAEGVLLLLLQLLLLWLVQLLWPRRATIASSSSFTRHRLLLLLKRTNAAGGVLWVLFLLRL